MPAGALMTGMDGVDAHDFAFHVELMAEAGLLEADVKHFLSGEPAAVLVRRLTWAGCEFLDSVRDPSLWERAKQSVIKPTASFSFELLKTWLKAELQQSLPSVRSLLP